MQRFKIESINKKDCTVSVVGSKETFSLYGNDINSLKVGGKFNVIKDNTLGYEDRVYLFHGGCYMANEPVSYDKYCCQRYIKDLPGVFDRFKLDRAAFRIAIAYDCFQRGYFPSLITWRNLRKVCLDKKYPLLKEIAYLER